jgi:hypothetical protein
MARQFSLAEFKAELVTQIPRFRHYVSSVTEDSWDSINGCCLLTQLGRYVRYQLAEAEAGGEMAAIFRVIEQGASEGDRYLQNDIAACFLENLINADFFKLHNYAVAFMGPASRDFCRVWDEFTGVETEGLWPKDSTT